ncbi:MAG: PAS domain-containing protein [Oligoflexia bacterium]|nr:PAS domain-containing protein [Oligoflexia bacterium]
MKENKKLQEQEQEIIDLRRAYLNIVEDLERKNMELESGQRIYLSLMEDMERKNQELVEKKAYVENILGSIMEMLFVLQADGTIEVVNAAVLTLLEYREEEIVGKKIDFILSGAQYIKTFLNIGFGSINHLEITFISKTGTKIHALCSYLIMQLEKNKMQGILCARDISDRKKIEDEIKENLKEATINLFQAEKMSALGELTAGIAHEIKQPLNVIRMIAQSLEMDIKKNRLKEDELKSGLIDVKKQIDRMSEIIEHMRIFTRRAGTFMEKKDINEVVQTTCKFFYQQLKAHDIELSSQLGSNLPTVLLDPVQIEQVIINLINNAKDAFETANMKGEEAKIEIKTYLIEEKESPLEGKLVVLEVIDNAGGIPEEVARKIFDPFFTTKAPGKGTGLGLSISKKIIENHRGTITLKTKLQEGSCFTISLPICL